MTVLTLGGPPMGARVVLSFASKSPLWLVSNQTWIGLLAGNPVAETVTTPPPCPATSMEGFTVSSRAPGPPWCPACAGSLSQEVRSANAEKTKALCKSFMVVASLHAESQASRADGGRGAPPQRQGSAAQNGQSRRVALASRPSGVLG